MTSIIYIVHQIVHSFRVVRNAGRADVKFVNGGEPSVAITSPFIFCLFFYLLYFPRFTAIIDVPTHIIIKHIFLRRIDAIEKQLIY